MTNSNKGVSVDGAIDTDIQERLGEKLKEAYSDVINEPVPDRFLELLNQLSQQSGTDGNDSSNE